ncbi:hypothetical protein ACIBG8_04865 [Nonomuraea sp. NPDC050556]|uniref:hypothetical protein n=1 Tax=Nonomuraea sp. NPDC050556 TaxID=3364369 RepID=UPI00379FA2F7
MRRTIAVLAAATLSLGAVATQAQADTARSWYGLTLNLPSGWAMTKVPPAGLGGHMLGVHPKSWKGFDFWRPGGFYLAPPSLDSSGDWPVKYLDDRFGFDESHSGVAENRASCVATGKDGKVVDAKSAKIVDRAALPMAAGKSWVRRVWQVKCANGSTQLIGIWHYAKAKLTVKGAGDIKAFDRILATVDPTRFKLPKG